MEAKMSICPSLVIPPPIQPCSNAQTEHGIEILSWQEPKEHGSKNVHVGGAQSCAGQGALLQAQCLLPEILVWYKKSSSATRDPEERPWERLCFSQ